MSTPHAGCEVARICLQVLPCPAKNSMNVSSFRCMLLSIYMQGMCHACNDAGAHVPWTAFFKIAPKHVPYFSLYMNMHLYAGNENGCASIHVYIHACLNVYMYIYIFIYMHMYGHACRFRPILHFTRVSGPHQTCAGFLQSLPRWPAKWRPQKFMDGQGMPHVWHLSC